MLEPGGRIANVANLGRKPYRSLAADVIHILQDRLGLLLRGEIVWQKGAGASGSCAWGSFRSPSNPVLRDVTQRVIVASKGRFQRALTVDERRRRGVPHEATIATEDFMALTLDVWQTPSESARRVGHPAPFPVDLPQRLIELYTFAGDLVLDPFMGSGSTPSPPRTPTAATSATTSTRAMSNWRSHVSTTKATHRSPSPSDWPGRRNGSTRSSPPPVSRPRDPTCASRAAA